MQHFAASLRPGQQTTHSLRAHQYHSSRKRKRNEDDGDQSPISSDDEATGSSPISSAPPYVSSDPLESAQLRVAGLLPKDAANFQIPSRPFPHAPAQAQRPSLNSTKVQQELASLDPPLFAANATSKTGPVGRPNEASALRQTHLNVLVTLMHRCLLEGDYHRAGRAWGMILRSQIAGAPIDPRVRGRWGIGAEILLRRGAPGQYRSNQSGHGDDPNEQSSPNEEDLYTDQGFELAKEYYERLIVQYPTRKQHRHAIDARTFYPAMFSLWIYEVCQKSKRARKQQSLDDRASPFANISSDDPSHTLGFESAIRAEELRHARLIADRQDRVIVSPPFDKHPELLQLRGMVSLWIGDLILGEDASNDDWTSTSLDDPSTLSYEAAQEKVDRYIASGREFNRALEFLKRAQKYGRNLTESLASTSAKIEDLGKKIDSLNH